jgi:hypothetical protein
LLLEAAMKYLGLVVAGTLVAAAGLANAAFAASGSLGPATHGMTHVNQPPGSLAPRIIHPRSTQISPHIGLPGISGFGSAPISPHIGLPGFSGFPQPSDHQFRHRFHHGGHGSDVAFWGYGGDYDSDGYADTIPMADEFGFFSEGGRVTMNGDKPVYHYDRSYPYDWYGGPRATAAAAPTGLHCQVQSVWDEEGRSQVPVRVCRPN